MLKLSQKYKEFLQVKCKREFLEGTTAAGKTTVGIFKFMCMVADSDKRFHLIAAEDVGTAEKNVINSENGLLEQFEGIAEYYPKGKDKIRLPHIEYETNKGTKIIYVCGYGDKKRWKKVLGGQLGCTYLDEVNLADMEFMREVTHRCKYMMTTSNPDDPNLDIYKEFINKSRPIKKYEKDYPMELLKELKEPHVSGWVHWYFTFNDNATLTKEDIQEKIDATPIGTKMYKNKILGLRGKATGLCFNLKPENIITVEQAKKKKFKILSIGCDTSYSKITHDKVTLEGIGITVDNKCVLLKERTFNNKDRTIPFAPSDVVKWIVEFMEEFKNEWGFARTCFIDNADQGTIMEAQKAKRKNGLVYNFESAWKKTKIITRVQLEESWLQTGDFLIVNTCTDYINECNVYSFDEDNQPEDSNDHSINGCQYAWLPHKKKIGNWEVLKKLIKDDMEE